MKNTHIYGGRVSGANHSVVAVSDPFSADICDLSCFLQEKALIPSWIVKISALGIGAVSLYLLAVGFDKGLITYAVSSGPVDLVMIIIELVIAVYLLYLGIRHKKYSAVILVLVQAALILWFEMTYGRHIELTYNLFFDQFSIIMALIVGIIGSLICVYSLGYMETYHQHHPEIKDRRRTVLFPAVCLPLRHVRTGLFQ